MSVLLKDMGTVDYHTCWEFQEEIFGRLVSAKNGQEVQATDSQAGPMLILCEHPHVYTLGRSGAGSNMLITDDFLKKIGATYCKTNRGGDITYHGPGQLVGYPILDLEKLGLGLKDYIHTLEQAIIETIAHFGIQGTRSQGATGVWLEPSDGKGLRKISAIGVRSSRFVTMHGFSLNVNPAMEYFNYINPCGFVDRGVTSMEAELGEKADMEKVKEIFTLNFKKLFNIAELIEQ